MWSRHLWRWTCVVYLLFWPLFLCIIIYRTIWLTYWFLVLINSWAWCVFINSWAWDRLESSRNGFIVVWWLWIGCGIILSNCWICTICNICIIVSIYSVNSYRIIISRCIIITTGCIRLYRFIFIFLNKILPFLFLILIMQPTLIPILIQLIPINSFQIIFKLNPILIIRHRIYRKMSSWWDSKYMSLIMYHINYVLILIFST